MSATPGNGGIASISERLQHEVSQVLGLSPDAVSLLYVNGWRMDLSSLTALAFVPGDRRPALIAKVAAGEVVGRVRSEAANLAILARSPLPELAASVPRPLAFVESDGTAILLESAVPGERFDPAGRGASIARFVELAADWLVLFHRGTGAEVRPLTGDDVERLFQEPLGRYLQRFRPSLAERRFLERMLRAAEDLVGVALPLVYHHNDFCPPNLLLAAGRLGVIDWETPFTPRLPAFDLIHLLACLGGEPRGRRGPAPDDLDRYEQAFFEDNRLSRAARAAAARYAAAMNIPGDVLRLLFAVYWVDYALEKADALSVAEAPDDPAGEPPHDLGVWSLARFEDGTCLNLRRLAERERSIVFP